MANTFSLILVIVTLVTGVVWALEKLVWAKQRAQKLAEVEAQTVDGLEESVAVKVAPQPWWVENSVSIFPVIAFVLVLRSFIFEPFQDPIRLHDAMMPPCWWETSFWWKNTLTASKIRYSVLS